MMEQLKYRLAFFLMLCCIILSYQGCTSLDEVNDRIDGVEKEIKNLQTALKQMQQAYEDGKLVKSYSRIGTTEGSNDGWIITFSDGTSITLLNGFQSVEQDHGYVIFTMQDGTSFTFKLYDEMSVPRLTSLEFRASANPKDLIEDVYGEIIGDSVVECWARYIMDSKVLIPHFTFDGDEVVMGDNVLTSDVSVCDFKTPVKITVKAGDRTKDYNVYMHAFTGLPVLWIETEDRAEILSKEEYLNANFRLVEDVKTRAPGDVVEVDGTIKGRGNSTWNMIKKPYAIKFEEKQSFLDEPKNKSWVLLANYADKTNIRNATAFYMGKISNLEYTPRFHFVDVMLNGRYNGTYQLGDKIKIGKNRVNVGDDGFLLEIDNKPNADEITFRIPHIERPVNIKEPQVEVDDENFKYITEYMVTVDSVLFSDNFKDPDNGWQKYMDMDSFVDWYLINEIAKNSDANFWSSCYMNLKRGEKLKMGPIWDFDIAFGNMNLNDYYKYTGFWVKFVKWYARLFQDPAFVLRVKERFAYFYQKQDDIMNEINLNAQYLKYSVEENDNRWGIFYEPMTFNYDVWGNYQNEVQYLKQWLNKRFEWLNWQINAL